MFTITIVLGSVLAVSRLTKDTIGQLINNECTFEHTCTSYVATVSLTFALTNICNTHNSHAYYNTYIHTYIHTYIQTVDPDQLSKSLWPTVTKNSIGH